MNTDREIVIIGGGVAGMSAAQYAARANMDTLLIEEMAPGGQSLLISDLENYPGFENPISGIELSQKMEKQAKSFGADFMSTTVTSLKKEGDVFSLETRKGTFTAMAVILATGAKHRLLDIPGEKEFSGRGVSYCATCDGPFFKNKKILVVGGGDAACDEAMFLVKITDKLVMVHRRDRFRAQKSLADRVLKNKNIDVRFNTVAKEIRGTNQVERVLLSQVDSGREYEEEFDAVFIFVGSIPQTALVPDVPKDEGGFILTDMRMETNIPGLFAAGDVRATPFRQIVVAAADGAIAAHVAAQHVDDLKGQAYE